MVSPTIRNEILAALEKLGEQEQRRVLEFARKLKHSRPKGTPGKQLVALATGIELDDLRLMSEAIEEAFEQVDLP